MTSVISSVTSWLGGSRERDRTPPGEEERSKEETRSAVETGSGVESPSNETTSSAENEDKGVEEVPSAKSGISVDVNLQEASEKAVNAAKEWGSYLFTFGKTATEQVAGQVAKTAMQLKQTVEGKTILGDFAREQDKFISEHRDKKKQSEAAVPPWVGYNEEETMKAQILALSKDKRNFLRNPPAGVQFNFDYESNFLVGMVMLEEDPNLKEMRFKIVPKEIKEEQFWRNYFYRVSLIKQSTQLTSLAQHTGSKGSVARSPIKSGVAVSPIAGVARSEAGDTEETPVGSPPALENEFVSDSFQEGDLDADDLKKEMDQLGVSEDKKVTEDELPEWERELQAELQEYEVVDDGNNTDDADLEREIMDQIEAESKQII